MVHSPGFCEAPSILQKRAFSFIFAVHCLTMPEEDTKRKGACMHSLIGVRKKEVRELAESTSIPPEHTYPVW